MSAATTSGEDRKVPGEGTSLTAERWASSKTESTVRTRDDVGVASGDVAWALAQGSGRITLVELLRAVRAGVVPAFRARPTVQVCDVWVERTAVAAYLGSGDDGGGAGSAH